MMDLSKPRPRMVLCIWCGFVFKHYPQAGQRMRLILPCGHCALVKGVWSDR